MLTVGEQGYTRATVSAVCAQAQVSRGTFYEAFDGLQECFVAVIDEGARRACELIDRAFAGKRCWREGIRAALGALLVLLDDEPLLARVWFVETLAAGDWALRHRGRHLASLTRKITERWPPPADAEVNPLAGTGTMELVMGVIHTGLLSGRREPLIELLGPLMGLITAVYLDREAAAVEIQRGDAHARAIVLGRTLAPAAPGDDEVVDVPRALLDPRAHRTRACLQYLVECPGASNREIARAAGVAHDTHISTVLARLASMGLLVKHAGRPGGPNAWFASPRGLSVAHSLRVPQYLHDGRVPTSPFRGGRGRMDPYGL